MDRYNVIGNAYLNKWESNFDKKNDMISKWKKTTCANGRTFHTSRCLQPVATVANLF